MLNLREDTELCALFKAESEERLERLESGLLRIEREAADRATADELFRDIHTLKGSAAMVGAGSIQAIAHTFEDVLGGVVRGGGAPQADVLARLGRGLDAMRRLVEEVVGGETSGIDVYAALDDLRGVAAPAGGGDAPQAAVETETPPWTSPASEMTPEPLPSTPVPPEPALPGPIASAPIGPVAAGPSIPDPPASDPPAIPTPPSPEPEAIPDDAPAGPSGVWRGAEPLSPRPFQIDTIRVEPAKLDALLTHAGELAVARTRLARRSSEAEALMALWEDHVREMAVYRALLRDTATLLDREDADRMLAASEREKLRSDRVGEELERLRAGLAEERAKLDFVANELGDGIRSVRLMPLTTIFHLFPRMVRDLAREQGKEVRLAIEGGDTAVDKRILEEIKDPLMHMLRNAVDHGVELPEERERAGKDRTATITLRASQSPTSTIIEVRDDGRGLDLERISRTARQRGLHDGEELAGMTDAQLGGLIFTPGFSTRERVTGVSGRGVGMDVVRANIERLKGSIAISSTRGNGSAFTIQLPLKLAAARVLIASVGDQIFALPVETVRGGMILSPEEVQFADGRETIVLDGEPVSVAPLAELLELSLPDLPLPDLPLPEPASRAAGGEAAKPGRERAHCVILQEGGEKFGVIVDALIDEQEIVIKPESALLRRVRNVSGSTILGSGKVCVILNAFDLLKSIRTRTATGPTLPPVVEAPAVRSILLVEDSLTTRTQVKRILEGAGYAVTTAVDGMDGLAKLGARLFDAIISDVQMPNMDGLSMTARIREQERYAALPIILMTSLAREEDRRRGIEVGASAYLTKPAFDQKVLLDTLRRLV
jgi:two-component system chemotaxis sensor kinase CheA